MLVVAIGFLLAIGQCLTVGPVNAEALRRGLTGGFRAALAVELGSCIGDGLWAALALAGLGTLFAFQVMDVAGTLAGATLLGWLAIRGWQEAALAVMDPTATRGQHTRLPAFWAGALLGIANPSSAAFWAGLGATLLAGGLPVHGAGALIQFASGYYVALLFWCFVFAAAVWQAGLRLPVWVQIWLQRAVACLLGLFAVVSLMSMLRRHLHVAP